MRLWRRSSITLAVLALLASLQTVTAPSALAAEYDCKNWSTLSAFDDGQLFRARSCTEKAGSGPYVGQVRGHTKVECVNPDHCSRIDSDSVSIILWHWDPTVAAWTVAAARGYDHNTYGDHSEDYYTPWVCDADYPGLDKWYTKTVELRAVSWSGQQGSPHDHQSYQAEINPC